MGRSATSTSPGPAARPAPGQPAARNSAARRTRHQV